MLLSPAVCCLLLSAASWLLLCPPPPRAHTQSTALFLFPTKALAQDQLRVLRQLLEDAFGPAAAAAAGGGSAAGGTAAAAAAAGGDWVPSVDVYDGDTPQECRPAIRARAQLLITNPDMLHQAILPCHTNFERLLKNLTYVVVDEVGRLGGGGSGRGGGSEEVGKRGQWSRRGGGGQGGGLHNGVGKWWRERPSKWERLARGYGRGFRDRVDDEEGGLWLSWGVPLGAYWVRVCKETKCVGACLGGMILGPRFVGPALFLLDGRKQTLRPFLSVLCAVWCVPCCAGSCVPWCVWLPHCPGAAKAEEAV